MAGDETQKEAPEETVDVTPESTEENADDAGDETTQQSAGEDTDIDDLVKEAVEAELAEQKDTVLRAQAEVQNMRRRCEADVEKAHKFALEKFSTELLTVIDNLERALESAPDTEADNIRAIREGVELTLKGFLETCEKFNIRQMDPEGEPFDPQMHQAMSMVPNPDVEPNTVVAVVQKGYLLNDRVIRPAMVMVSKAE